MKNLLSGKLNRRRQLGFTLAEVVIAIVVSALLVVGSVEIVRHMVVTTAQNRASTVAMLQVQYVGFWITEDVVQARADHVCIGGMEGCPSDFLTVRWTQWNGIEHKIVYAVEGEETWKLYRRECYTPVGGSEMIDQGTVAIGEYLDPAGTRCTWATDKDGNMTELLKLDVTANVDGKIATRTYEINPRSK